MMKYKISLLFVFICCLLTTNSASQVIVNSNIIRGGNFVTPKISENDVNKIVERALVKRGFKVIPKMDSLSNMLVIETYLYQYPGQFPTIVLLARSKKGVHYIDGDSVKIYLTPSDGFFKLLNRLLESLPGYFDPEVNYAVDIHSIFSNSNVSITSISSEIINNSIQIRSKIKISIRGSELSDFFLEDLNSYLLLSSNFRTIQSNVGSQPISLVLSYDDKGKFILKEIDSKNVFNTRQKQKLNDFIRAIPTWLEQSGPDIVIELSRKL